MRLIIAFLLFAIVCLGSVTTILALGAPLYTVPSFVYVGIATLGLLAALAGWACTA